VDVLGWKVSERALAILEIKSRVADVQDVHAAMDRRGRIVPLAAARERGWRPAHVGRILAVAGTHANRSAIRTHAATFGAAFPGDTRAVRRWLAGPTSDFAGVWYLPPVRQASR